MLHAAQVRNRFQIQVVEKKSGKSNKEEDQSLMLDSGTKYKDSRFTKLCMESGIKRHFTIWKTPQQNSVAKRMNRSLAERDRCIKLNVELEKKFWTEVVSMACYLINRSPMVALDGKVVEEVWTSNEVDYSRLRVFRCPAYAHIAGDERSKLDAKSRQCIFLGYHKREKGFKLWDPKANKVVIARDVIFDEKFRLHNT